MNNIIDLEQFLKDQLPPSFWASIPTTLKLAYSAADLLCSQEPILQVASAKANHGRIISWAVDLAFQRLIDSGQWPAECRWRKFAKPTGNYLEIKLSHSVLTICQVDDPKKQPRNVVFRENGRLNNQFLLSFPEEAIDEDIHGLPHFLLLHGYQSLTFANIAIPHSDHKLGHIYRTPNLLTMPHAVPISVPPPENTDTDAILILKQDIEKWQKDHGE